MNSPLIKPALSHWLRLPRYMDLAKDTCANSFSRDDLEREKVAVYG